MGRDRYGWTLTVVAVSAFMVTLDNTVTNIALKTIREHFGTTLPTATWVTTSYILIFSCLMIAGGRLVDVYGVRRIFTLGMGTFTLASLGCGLSQELSQLIVCRIVQGAGASLALPATLVMVMNKRTDKQKSLGNLVFILTGTVASALGPTIGGIITDAFSWHWIFLINVGPGLLAILLGLLVLDGKSENRPESVDLPAVLTSATLLFSITYGVHAGGDVGWTHPSVLAVFTLALVSLLSFVLVEKWAPNPMITTEFFRNKAFSGGLAGQILWGMGFSGVLTYSGNFMQDVLGWSASQAGTVFIPPAVIIGLLTPVGFWLAGRFGPRIPIGTGMVLMSCGLIAFSGLRQGDDFVDILPGIILVGAGSALTMPLGLYVLKAVPESRTGVAGGVINVGREISAALGIVVLGALLNAMMRSAREEGSDPVEAMERGSSAALLLGAAIVLVGAVIVVFTLQRKSELTDKTEGAAPPPEPSSVTSGSFPVIPDWWGTNRKAEIPSAWPPPPPYSPYETTTEGDRTWAGR
ncbi:MFS transporter [Actinocorallia sp. API 0066]|uniref:MFS transporter n=1 Tax=Actinocorallia sp. API 0066 TaxID=2896846 RepID=UPI001E5B5F75|nr:MFS transporter [Actinocorallia sp. API 0066]MCD0450565.1 MFS transporter [Actinocorallia sp. API 0066]